MELTFHKSVSGQYTRYSSVLSGSSEKTTELYMEILTEHEPLVGEQYANALMILSFFDCMREGGSVRVAASLEEELITNLEELSKVWALWRPDRYHEIDIVAPSYRYEREEISKPDISAFSGGVDACYVIAHSLTPGLKPRVDVKASVLIHGADIPLHDKKRCKNTAETFNQVYRECSDTLKEYGMPLYPVRTNIREVNPHWGDIFLSVVVACQRLFSHTYAGGVMGSDQTCDLGMLSFPWGENPITNHLYSTPEFKLTVLGLTLGRTGRCDMVAKFPALLRGLRVCFQNNANGGNCGVCEKCVRTKLNLIACGHGDNSLFRVPFKVRQIRKLKPHDRFHAGYFSEIVTWDQHHDHLLPKSVVRTVNRFVKRSYAGELILECSRTRARMPLTEYLLALCFGGILSAIKGLRRILGF